MRRLIVSILAVSVLAVVALAAEPAPVLITDAYFVVDGGGAVHLFGHDVTPISIGLGDKFTLTLDWRTPEGAKSPCDARAKDGCRLILEVYGVSADGTRKRSYGWNEGLEVRLNASKYSMAVTIPYDIPREKAPTGDAVLVVKWMHSGTELYRYEIPLNIHG